MKIKYEFKKYSDDPYVKSFIKWIEPKLSNEGVFNHSYTTSKKPAKKFKFNSIYSAYESYEWNEKNFVKNQEELDSYSIELNKGLTNHDIEQVKKGCKDILIWGGVYKKGNVEKIEKKSILEELIKIKKNIILASCDIEKLQKFHCNSGFSKIYSTIIDNFIIYDSRVSCALCYLIRLYAEEKSKKEKSKYEIPESLKFAYSVGRSNNRNPNKGSFKFKNLNQYNYLKYNITASWLLKLILDKTKSKFNELSENIQLRALESALFMIGYKIN